MPSQYVIGALGKEFGRQPSPHLMGVGERSSAGQAHGETAIRAEYGTAQIDLPRSVFGLRDIGEGGDRRTAAGPQCGEHGPFRGDRGPGLLVVEAGEQLDEASTPTPTSCGQR